MHIKGKKALVLGIDANGFEALKALTLLGAKVTAYDPAPSPSWKERITRELPSLAPHIVYGEEIPPHLVEADLAILSSPRSLVQPILDRIIKKNIPIKTPLELAVDTSNIPFIAITGTNGKSSVAKMTEQMLTLSGKSVFLGGGYFNPYLRIVTAKKKFELAVFEIGSGVLQRINSLKPAVAVVTNLVPSHFDRHENIEDYFNTKARVFSGQTEKEILVYDADNEFAADLSKKARSHLFPIYLSNPQEYSSQLSDCAYHEKKNLYFCRQGQEPEIYSMENMRVKGTHHIVNALLALSAARLMGANPQAIQTGLDSFTGLPHRMQKCFTKQHLTFYDDTAAWNPGATAWGLTAFKKPVLLIAGGLEAGADYSTLYQYIQKKVKILILIGRAREKMHSQLKEATQTYVIENLEEAVRLAIQLGQKGDTIVFSPATPPEPRLYEGYEGRGKKYLELIQKEFESDFEGRRVRDTLDRRGIKI